MVLDPLKNEPSLTTSAQTPEQPDRIVQMPNGRKVSLATRAEMQDLQDAVAYATQLMKSNKAATASLETKIKSLEAQIKAYASLRQQRDLNTLWQTYVHWHTYW
jgi:cell division septal protein FtsQ